MSGSREKRVFYDFKIIVSNKLHTRCTIEGAKLMITKHDVVFQKLLDLDAFNVHSY